MLVQEATALTHLVIVKLTTESKMAQTSSILVVCDCRVTFAVVDMLSCTGCGAHREPYEQWGLLRSDLGPCPIAHLLLIEIPMPTISIIGGEIEGKEREDAETGTHLGHSRYTWR